jgi:hypothetical protein
MKDQQREILNQVATGAISAEEGAARLESLEAGPAPVEAPAAAPVATAPSGGSTRQVKVVSQIGTAEIVGDPSVAFVTADGPHRARQDGDTMIIDHLPIGEDDNFSFGGDSGRRVLINGFDIQRRRLTVRMNPDLALIATVQAGNVRVDGVHGPISADVQAGNCTISDFRNPLNVVVQAGNVSAIGRLDGGASKVRCEMGSVKISLEKGSSVRITARTTMGKVGIEGGATHTSAAARDSKVVTIGGGVGTLDVDCTMGNVKVVMD